MNKEQYTVDQSKLEEAHNTSNREWLDSTFSEARQVIENGGTVRIEQQFSDSSVELVSIIDNLEGLNHYKKKYAP